MANAPSSGSRLTGLGILFSVLLVFGLIGLGAWIVVRQLMPKPATPVVAGGGGGGAAGGAPAGLGFDASKLAETKDTAPKLGNAVAYVPKDNVIDIELSEYAGYAGLIAANGGLEANDNSYFAQKCGFKVRLKLSEEESWAALNAGKMAASATTADVLAVYGRQFQVVVPAQIGYSRGADGLVVRNDIRKVNDLKGKVVISSQFTESDFFIRYLAKQAGMGVNMLEDMKAKQDPEAVNLVYTEDGFTAGDLFLDAVKANSKALAGCVTWAPKTTEIPAATDKAKLLVSNKNLLIIADILIVNRGFAEKNPKMVQGLVDGLLAGNKMVRDNPEANAEVVGKAFKWERSKTLAELQKVHLANLPEQLAFFGGGIKEGGSFASIYQSAVLAYGPEIIPDAVDSDHFVMLDALKAAQTSGLYANEVAAITPLSSGPTGQAEKDPILSQDIRFFFEPNSSALDMKKTENLALLNSIKRILDVAPGSKIILVGHVDNTRIPELMKTGGQALVDKMALEAMQLSKDRAAEVMKQLAAVEKVDPKRLETVGRGWMQPVSQSNPDLNRRVEVQWFTLE
jgi:NitT/TauT family transport system substrate-binding protein